jgi:hypothetical protein
MLNLKGNRTSPREGMSLPGDGASWLSRVEELVVDARGLRGIRSEERFGRVWLSMSTPSNEFD